MGIRFKSIAIGQSQMHMVHAGYLELEAAITVRLKPVQLVQDVRVFVAVAAKVIPINGELKFRVREGDGQLKLLIDDEGETAIAFLRQPAGRENLKGIK